ncbi:MAG TPA: histidine kinase dimerization/phospho-acceptor domain-containing protein [Polyangiaceae bacterium]
MIRNPVLRLVLRIVGAVLAVDLATAWVFWVFAPRWLLLDEGVASAMSTTAIVVALALTTGELLVLLGLALGNRRVLDGGAEIQPADLLRLFTVPSRIGYARFALALLFGATTMLERPEGVDAYTQGALVVLFMTLVTTSSLPLYVAARAAVARALELAPVGVSRDAVALLVRSGRASRLRLRFLVALAAPVALVAVGASLLVYAHAHAAELAARRADATAFASGTLDLVEGSAEGRPAAIAAGRALGYVAGSKDKDDAHVSVPLEDGLVTVHYEPAGPGVASVSWALATLLAVAFASIAGARIGRRFSQDVVLAQREIESMGIADGLQGSRVVSEATFQSVRGLAAAVDELGGVFREFAAAQERAIVARAAAERMRALLLATMSHDLKGPLNAILGFAALLERSALTDGQRESVVIIRQRGGELLYLIQTVLDAARFEAGPIDLARHEAPAHDIVMAAALDAQELLQGSSRELTVSIAENLPVLEVDSARIVQAIVSLMHAASRMSEKGTIRLRAERGPGGSLRVFVDADAPILSPEESTQIAEADATASVRIASTAAGGWGRRPMSLALGLSIARSILEAHGGSLAVTAAASAPLRLLANVPSASATATVKMDVPPEM